MSLNRTVLDWPRFAEELPPMGRFISVIIPNRNGAATIETCLEAVFSSRYEPFEVLVVVPADV